MKNTVIIVLVIFLTFHLWFPIVTAGKCDYGSVRAWARANGGEWKNATAHPSLKPGDEFTIKIAVEPSVDLQVFFIKLHEFGTPVYEVLAGPSRLNELFECRGTIPANQSFTYEWTMRVRPTTTWTHGSAPLELITQFNRDDTTECQVDFDVIIGYITPATETNAPNKGTITAHPTYNGCFPGISMDWMLFALLMLCVLLLLWIRLE